MARKKDVIVLREDIGTYRLFYSHEARCRVGPADQTGVVPKSLRPLRFSLSIRPRFAIRESSCATHRSTEAQARQC